MANTELLEKALIKCKISKRKLAEYIGISHQALYSKLNNTTEFKASEIMKIAEVLNLSVSEKDSIFLHETPTQKKTRAGARKKRPLVGEITYPK